MLQLVWGLFLIVLLAGACAVLASGGKADAALLPLPLLSGMALLLYGFGLAGALRIGAALAVVLLVAVWAVGLVRLRPAGFVKACREAVSTPGLALFVGGAAFFWVLFFVLQPMFTQWDEFTAWGLAPKMVVERGAFYVADPVNLKASFTYPATSLVTFLFQPFGRWAEWACLAALDTLALACVAAATALPRSRWFASVGVFAAGAVLPYFFPGSRAGGLRHPVCECHGGPAHGHAVRGHPLPVFRHRTASWVLLADGAAAGIADADQGYLFCLRPDCGVPHRVGLVGRRGRPLP